MRPGSRVPYVPTAALLVRRDAVLRVARDGHVFDPALRYGEDVDLVWRLDAAGRRVRYEPSVQVRHQDPDTWTELLSRRFRYGTSAAPLARRHPGAAPPLVLHPWPAAVVASVLARRPDAALAAYATAIGTMNRTLRRAGLPTEGVHAATVTGVRQTWLGVARYAGQFTAPLLAAAVIRPGGHGARRRWGRRATAASLLLGPATAAYSATRPQLDPLRFVLARIADDVAYGAGVWTGSLRERTAAALLPRVAWQPFRIEPGRTSAPPQGAGTFPGSVPPKTKGAL
nr:glycosyltransferase family 2 protein [Streptomyces sp. alain-838]